LPRILAGIRGLNLPLLLLDGALLAAVLIALRVAWVYAESWIAYAIRRLVKQPASRAPAREMFIVGWTGMRGVIALAAAMSLPELLDDGSAFPQRDVLIFLTFCVILITLVAQGISLPSLIRKLGMAGTSSPNGEENEARRRILSAAMNHIRDLRNRDNPSDEEILRACFINRFGLKTDTFRGGVEFGSLEE